MRNQPVRRLSAAWTCLPGRARWLLKNGRAKKPRSTSCGRRPLKCWSGMKTSIAVIGFMGTGKSAVGKALAQKLHKELIGLDDVISTKAGKTIPEIFRQDGETRFRELEIEAV